MLQSEFRVKGENESSRHLGKTKVALDAEMGSTGGVMTTGSIRLTAKGLLWLKQFVPQGCIYWRCGSWCCILQCCRTLEKCSLLGDVSVTGGVL